MAMTINWSYEGDSSPENWGSLEPSFAPCADGMYQSPVDIPAVARLNYEGMTCAYNKTAVIIADVNRSLQADCNDGGTMEFNGAVYSLQQFHFHSPSEHTLAGDYVDMEMHLVHKDSGGNLAVIGVMMVEGAENPGILPVWNNMPSRGSDLVTKYRAVVNVVDLLPEDRSYYAYTGSLTTPPCTEGVLWIVLAQPLEISAKQLAAFRAIYDGNNRPVQPMNGREFF